MDVLQPGAALLFFPVVGLELCLPFLQLALLAGECGLALRKCLLEIAVADQSVALVKREEVLQALLFPEKERTKPRVNTQCNGDKTLSAAPRTWR